MEIAKGKSKNVVKDEKFGEKVENNFNIHQRLSYIEKEEMVAVSKVEYQKSAISGNLEEIDMVVDIITLRKTPPYESNIWEEEQKCNIVWKKHEEY